MKVLPRIIIPVVVALAIVIVALSSSSKRYIVGEIYLAPLEKTGLYILNFNEREMLGSVLEGVVEEIGWNGSVIVCRVKKHYSNEQDGLYVINKETREISGPVAESYSEENGINLVPVEEAYDSLFFFPLPWK